MKVEMAEMQIKINILESQVRKIKLQSDEDATTILEKLGVKVDVEESTQKIDWMKFAIDRLT